MDLIQQDQKLQLNYDNIPSGFKLIAQQIEIELKNKKPHFQFISIPFMRENYFENFKNECTEDLESFGINIFDTQKQIKKFLQIICNRQINEEHISLIRQNINKLDINTFGLPELEKFKQIQSEYDITIYDFYQLQDNTICVYELEQLDLPIDLFQKHIKNDEKYIMNQIINQSNYYFNCLYGNLNYKNPHYRSHYIKISEQGEVRVKSAIFIQQDQRSGSYSTKYESSGSYNFEIESYYLHMRKKQIYYDKIQEMKSKIKIKKQNILNVIDTLAPSVLKADNNLKEILKIIQLHPKYHYFTIDDFDENHFFLKASSKSNKYLLRVEKYNSYEQANTAKYKYEQMRECQKQQEQMFLNIGECEVVVADDTWYIILEQELELKQSKDKLIAINNVDKISRIFSNIQCDQEYIFSYLITRTLNHFEKVEQFGFFFNHLFDCKHYLYISDKNKITESKILFQNPLFFKEETPYSRYYINMKQELIKNLYDTSSLDLKKIPFLYSAEKELALKRMQYLMLLLEQYPNLSTNNCFIDKTLKINISLETEKIHEKLESFKQIIKLEHQRFVCSFEDFPTFAQYLTQDNNIKYLKIKDNQQINDTKIQINTDYQNETLQSIQRIFQNVNQISLRISLNTDINYMKQLKNLKNIKIKNENIYLNLDVKENHMKKYLELFDNIQQFQEIKINFTKIGYFSYTYYLQKYETQSVRIKKNENQQRQNIVIDIDNFFHAHNLLNSVQQQDLLEKIQYFQSKYECIDIESQLKVNKINEKEEHVLYLNCTDSSQFNLGTIQIILKLTPYQNTYYLSIQSITCTTQHKFNNENDVFLVLERWIEYEQSTNFKKELLGATPYCYFDDYNLFSQRIYKQQKQLKQMNLYLPQKENPQQNINYTLNNLSQNGGTNFPNLLVLRLSWSFDLQNNHELIKNLMNAINQNKNINTVILPSFNERTRFLRKLKRIVHIHSCYQSRNEY